MAPRGTRRLLVLAAPEGVVADRTVDAAGLPHECPECGDAVVYWRDLDGVWQECYCDAGYVLLV